MTTLAIKNTKQFDYEVWQTNSYFSEDEYNQWLCNTVIPTLKEIYDTYEGKADVYILGDVINLLQTMQIKIQK